MNSIYKMEEKLKEILPEIIIQVSSEFEISGYCQLKNIYTPLHEIINEIGKELLEHIKTPEKKIFLPLNIKPQDTNSHPLHIYIAGIKIIRNVFLRNYLKEINEIYLIETCFLITSFFDGLEETFINNVNTGNLSFKELNERLQKIHKMVVIGKLSGYIAHEFNNILTIIKNWAQLGLIEKDEEIRVKSFESIVKNTERGSAITKSLLNFCRNIESNSLFTNINNFMDDLLITIEKKLIKEEIEIEKNYSLIPDISINRFALREAFFNILLNCCDSLKTSPKKITITTGLKNGTVEIIFSDNGKGISQENQKKLFEPFFTTIEKSEFSTGLGLGLTIASNIVKGHGGEIKIISEYGKGTDTIISIPIR